MTEDVRAPIEYDEKLKETDSAILFLIETDARGRRLEVWVPKSQIDEPTDELPEERGTFTIPEWLAIDKGLV